MAVAKFEFFGFLKWWQLRNLNFSISEHCRLMAVAKFDFFGFRKSAQSEQILSRFWADSEQILSRSWADPEQILNRSRAVPDQTFLNLKQTFDLGQMLIHRKLILIHQKVRRKSTKCQFLGIRTKSKNFGCESTPWADSEQILNRSWADREQILSSSWSDFPQLETNFWSWPNAYS